MKINFIHIISFITIGLLIQACNKPSPDVFVPSTVQSDTTWANADSTPSQILTPPPQPPVIDSFAINDDGETLTKGDSLSFNFPQGGCLASNQPNSTLKSSTNVRANITILKSIGDFIKNSVATVTKNNQLLIAGNFINIKLSNKGNPVYWNPNVPIQVKIKDTNPITATNFVIYQPIPGGKDSLWVAPPINNNSPRPIQIYTNPASGKTPKSTGYTITSNNIGWFGNAFFCDSSVPKTVINVWLPLNFTNKNTTVFAAFNSQKTVLKFKANPQGKSYSVMNVPLNTKLTIISISKLNGTSYLGTYTITATSSNPISLNPVVKTMQQINQYLNSL